MNLEIPKYLTKKRQLQKGLLDFIEEEGTIEEQFQNLVPILDLENIRKDKNELLALLYLISNIINNHRRKSDFFKKIEYVISFFQDDITKNFSNHDIFSIFKNNNRILFFFIQSKMITIDKWIASSCIPGSYEVKEKKYFYLAEMAQFLPDSMKRDIDKHKSKYELKVFNELRKIGENNKYICDLIRNDNIEDFISYTTEQNISLDIYIDQSKFETNNFLISNRYVNLIKYAAFFGSIKIFKYLFSQKHPDVSIWNYAIHGQNLELIQFLKQNDISPEKYINNYLSESIYCHHVKITDYLIQTELSNHTIEYESVFTSSISSYNYFFFPNENDLAKDNYFFCLCSNNNASLVSLILKNNQSNPDFDVNKMKPLHIAITKSLNEVSEILINYPETDVNLIDEEHETPLYLAVKYGNIGIIHLLLKHQKIDVNIPNKYKQSPLYLAVFKRSIEMVQILLQSSQIDVNFPNADDISPLGVAISDKSNEIIKLLLSHPMININHLDSGKTTPLSRAISIGSNDIAQLLLKNPKVDINLSSSDDNIPLNIAIARNNKEMIEILLKRPDIDASLKNSQNNLLCSAASSGNIEILKLLLNRPGIDINCQINGATPLYNAVYRECNEAALFLLNQKGINLKYEICTKNLNESTTKISTIFHLAIRCGNQTIVKFLLDNLAFDVNQKDLISKLDIEKNKIKSKEEETPLLIATKANNLDMIKILLSSPHIDINEISIYFSNYTFSCREEYTALYYAANNGLSDIVKLLISNNNINVNSEYIKTLPYPPDNFSFFINNLTQTSLIAAARKGFSNVI